ncbi:hypothetical protein ROZALSC1DRAFT_26888 [Rozella allomycis CSF55]|uniref:Histone acetyltransferases subunit 3 domain-containing protein n=1 Tax=Rozella allomycis (strain CSF55) TaxID=988480 RepID=A0A075B3W6_ROZAC|nr:Histone acetyltransferases subunit 3 domain-containing protein [Rozella allomycis CSF55]RKP21710.1 hypothetical protein ROZALSC1DRAFT_26888 [Rozella allomycis CSF55]|eukprot:EPZ35832.1 Histone acetyltransferases subunit 3 domain-containing protein [Rozella allomycis CSF55]
MPDVTELKKITDKVSDLTEPISEDLIKSILPELRTLSEQSKDRYQLVYSQFQKIESWVSLQMKGDVNEALPILEAELEARKEQDKKEKEEKEVKRIKVEIPSSFTQTQSFQKIGQSGPQMSAFPITPGTEYQISNNSKVHSTPTRVVPKAPDKIITNFDDKSSNGSVATTDKISVGSTVKIKFLPPKPKPESKNSKNKANLKERSYKTISPIEDASKPKNQIPISVFWSYAEPYFRPLTENDLKNLETKITDNPMFNEIADVDPSLQTRSGSGWGINELETPESQSHEGSPSGVKVSDQVVAKRFGPLTERLLAAFVDERDDDQEVEMGEDESMDIDEETIDDDDSTINEENVRSELLINQIVDEDVDVAVQREDDEICAEIRAIQAKLKKQRAVNSYRRNKLFEAARRYMVLQDFLHVLEEMDKQIDLGFTKRLKAKKKKKATSFPMNSKDKQSLQPTVNINILAEKRRLLIRKFKNIVPKSEELLCLKHSLFHEEEMKTFVEQRLGETNDLSSLPEIPLKLPAPFRVPVAIFPDSTLKN